MMKKQMGIASFGVVLLITSGALSARTNKMIDLSKLHPSQTTYDDVVAEYGHPPPL